MQHVAEQAMQQMFGEINLWEIRRNSLSTCRFIWHINEWEQNAEKNMKFILIWLSSF